jgi:hypothetical protein
MLTRPLLSGEASGKPVEYVLGSGNIPWAGRELALAIQSDVVYLLISNGDIHAKRPTSVK